MRLPFWPRPILLLGLLFLLTACEFPRVVEASPTATAVTEPAIPALASQPTRTVEPLSPPATATAVPQPTPTDDPNLPNWTVLIYMNGDNNLELANLLDMNEMERAGESGQVNVLVQIDRAAGETDADGDWTEARRYRIAGDDNPNAIGSELVAQLGEVNMGDPLVLADFITWGLTNYPANHAALIIWDHGAGWNGIAFDDDTADFGTPDFVSLPDLSGALARTLEQTGLDKLDVVGFDACLMAQLDVFQAVAPYAEYAVGSEELTPGQGWDYTAVLGQLMDEPSMDGARLAQQIAVNFVAYYTLVEPDDFVTMSAVDLAEVDGVTAALAHLAETLMGDEAQIAGAVTDARSGAEAYARVFAGEFDRYAAVDLHHLASILAQRSPDEAVQAAARSVLAAVETAVLANEFGSGFQHSGGMAIYFPRQAQYYDAAYASTTANIAWDRFLNQYYQAELTQLAPPELNLANVRGEMASAQNPAYLDFEIVGRSIENVTLLGGRYEEDGRRRLLEFDRLIPEPSFLPDGSSLSEWRDGVHEDFFIWDTRVTYLFDAAGAGDFVVMWPASVAEDGRRLYTVQGQFRRAAAAEAVAANLVFDQVTGRLVRVWGRQSDGGLAPGEIVPLPGDSFQIDNLFLDESNQILHQPGTTLVFAEEGPFFDWRPLPDGAYFLGLTVENAAGDTAVSFIDLNVENSDLTAGFQTYLDPYLGFQFLYPEDWYTPVYTRTLLYTGNRAGTTDFQITLYPDLGQPADAAALKVQTLNLFGPVDLLFEEEVTIAGLQGLRTAYGYETADGLARTGIFLTFVNDGDGYVIDVDGPQAEETATITAVDTIASSWQFVPAGIGLPPGEWAQIDLASFTVARPRDFAYEEVNDWQRFSSDRYTFVALRTQPASLAAPDVLAALVRDAGIGMVDFNAEPAFATLLGGSIWQRSNFSYRVDNGRSIWGFIMVKLENGREVVAWAEAPSETYNELEQSVFLTMVADLSLVE